MKKTSKDTKGTSRMGSNTFLRFSSLTVQMGVIIGFSTWGGIKLDEYFKTNNPYFTIVLSLLGIGIAMYVVIKDVTAQSKNDQDQ